MMKWDVKHDRAKKIICAFLDNAGYWEEREDLSEGLTDEEKEQVNEELSLMIASITKRYKLDVKLHAEEVPAEEVPAEEPKQETAEETQESAVEPEAPSEKHKKPRKPRTKKVKEVEREA